MMVGLEKVAGGEERRHSHLPATTEACEGKQDPLGAGGLAEQSGPRTSWGRQMAAIITVNWWGPL